MTTTPVTIRGTVHPDGSLEVEGRIDLPPGQVQVTLIPWPTLPPDDSFWTLMQSIWDGQKSRHHLSRSTEEVEAERHQTADEWEQRLAEIARIQAEAKRLRSVESPRP